MDRRIRAVIEHEAIERRLHETGGSLFGWEVDEHVFVACASGPGPGAKHRPRSFAPAPSAVAEVMERVRDVSHGRYGYVGSWHTHPCGAASPSGTDTGTAEAMAEQTDLMLPRPLLLILSTTGTARRVRLGELCAWRWQPGKRLKLTPIEDMQLQERYCPAAELLFAA
ncbi:MAG: Mov34/MPN/PAD-1 family protein [Actinomycetota bacterium]|nr:Mov34/MPN/PAD-1 family protein [Actinomycetota bacterium]